MKLEYGNPIPEPPGEDEYSGKFNLRVPKSLHYGVRKINRNTSQEHTR
ncbi:toxin-antitoxin system HicB family antitoxin [Paenibacillus polymyxa]